MFEEFEVRIKSDGTKKGNHIYISVSYDGMVWSSLLIPKEHIDTVVRSLKEHKESLGHDSKD